MALTGSGARRYAEALLGFATPENAVGSYRESLDRLAGALGADALRMLRDVRVPLEHRRAALAASLKGEPRAIRAVADLLLQRDRIAIVPDVARAYGDLVDRREGIVKAKITTPIALSEPERAGLVRRLEASSGKKVRATFMVDEGIIGGAKVQVGDRLIDATLRTQLDALARQLAG